MLAFFQSKEFDFEGIKHTNACLIIGIPVKIDRIIYDITHTTVIGISGTFVLRGVKIRGTWDPFGNPLNIKRCLTLLSPLRVDLADIVTAADEPFLKLVCVDELGEKKGCIE